MRRIPLLVAVLLALPLAGCGGRAADGPLLRLAEGIPAAVLQDAGGPGLLLRRGAAEATTLAGQLGLDPAAVEATAELGVPALRVVLADPGAVRSHLEAAGFAPAGEGAPEAAGWAVLVRPPGVGGYAGVPAVAVGGDRVAVGDLGQLAALLAGGPPVALAAEDLADADVALVSGPRPAAGERPAVVAAVVSSGPDGDGEIALHLVEPGTQADAVATSVLLRTAPPAGPDGQPVLEVGAALTAGGRVAVAVTWLADGAALRSGAPQAAAIAALG